MEDDIMNRGKHISFEDIDWFAVGLFIMGLFFLALGQGLLKL